MISCVCLLFYQHFIYIRVAVFSYGICIQSELLISGHPRCNIIYSFSLCYELLSGLRSSLRIFRFLCFTSAVSNKL